MNGRVQRHPARRFRARGPATLPGKLLVACLWVLLGVPLHAAQAAESAPDLLEDATVVEDPALSLSRVLDRTLEQSPARPTFTARARQSQAWVRYGGGWLASAPALTLRYQSDRLTGDRGLTEYEAGLELPLWRPGGRASTRAFGQALGSEAGADLDALRWQLAGRLRQALWDVAAAHSALASAQRLRQVADGVLRAVSRRRDLGDASLSDELLARSNALETAAGETQARAALQDAHRVYTSLTRLSRRPPLVAEQQSPLTEIAARHPLLVAADARLARAQANLSRVEKAGRASPSLLLGPRRERAAGDVVYYDSIGLTVRLPLATGSFAATRTAEAHSALIQAQADRDQVMRSLHLRLHEAGHALATARARLATLREAAALAQKQIHMAQVAYDAGEIDLMDLLRIQRMNLDAQRDAALLAVERNRRIALYNQAAGVLP